jgi:uncharacterized protein YegP (UPF0339 family)
MKVYVYIDHAGKGRFRAVARNGRTVEGSQGYSTKSNAKRAARRKYPDARFFEGLPD